LQAASFASAPPLWFCVLCPVVLGLLAPLLVNLSLNQVCAGHAILLPLPLLLPLLPLPLPLPLPAPWSKL